MSLASKALQVLGVRYEFYRIYVRENSGHRQAPPPRLTFQRIDGIALSRAPDLQISALQAYERPKEAFGFGVVIEDQVRSACWYWTGKTYEERGFWPLGPDEAKLVQIVTASDYQGRGLASHLIAWSSDQMAGAGFRRLFARIWHSNTGSIRAFEKAGWRPHAFVATFSLPLTHSVLRLERSIGGPWAVTFGKPVEKPPQKSPA